MFTGDEEQVVSVDKWYELMDERLARFNGFVGDRMCDTP